MRREGHQVINLQLLPHTPYSKNCCHVWSKVRTMTVKFWPDNSIFIQDAFDTWADVGVCPTWLPIITSKLIYFPTSGYNHRSTNRRCWEPEVRSIHMNNHGCWTAIDEKNYIANTCAGWLCGESTAWSSKTFPCTCYRVSGFSMMNQDEIMAAIAIDTEKINTLWTASAYADLTISWVSGSSSAR